METAMPAHDLVAPSARFRIAIPKAVCTARQWRAGQVFACVPKGEGLLLVPGPRREDLIGLIPGAVVDNHRDRTDRV